jgi:DNA repair protein RadC
LSRPVIQSVNDVSAQAIEIRDKKKEYLLAFFLNARHQLIAKETVSIGTLTASLAHPREIFAPAIGKAAAGVILVHNHPSGNPSPSDEDIRLTKRIAQAGQIMGIELLDHIILAENGCYSFKTAGQL